MSSEGDGAELMAAFKKGATRNLIANPPEVVSPGPGLSQESEEDIEADTIQVAPPIERRRLKCVRISPVRNREGYTFFEPEDEIQEIVRSFGKRGETLYEVRLRGDKTKQVSEIPGVTEGAHEHGVRVAVARKMILSTDKRPGLRQLHCSYYSAP